MLQFLRGEVELDYIDSKDTDSLSGVPLVASISETKNGIDPHSNLKKAPSNHAPLCDVTDVLINKKKASFRNKTLTEKSLLSTTDTDRCTKKNPFQSQTNKSDKRNHDDDDPSTNKKKADELNLSQLANYHAALAALKNLPLLDKEDSEEDEFRTYFSEIITHLWGRELLFVIRTDFLVRSHFNPKTRSTLTDWLVKVQLYLNMPTESLHLSVALADCYLARKTLDVHKYQLLGITALFVAGKVVGRAVAKPDSFCYLTDNSCRPNQMLRMERELLNCLHFEVNLPLAHNFLGRNLQACTDLPIGASVRQLECLCLYLFDLLLIDNASAIHLPSQRSAAALLLARRIFHPKLPDWTPTLNHYTGYSKGHLEPCAEIYLGLLKNVSSTNLKAAFQKFSSKRYGYISVSDKVANCPLFSSG